MGLDEDTALRPLGDDAWEGRIATGWETPRGPLGGYVMAIVLRALAAAVADETRQPRSVTMHFLRVPEPGPVTIRARVERAGRSLSSVSARLEQDGDLLALALGAYSRPWDGPLLDSPPAPEVDPPEPGREPGRPFREAKAPGFVERLTMQRRFGPRPFSAAATGETGGWLGLREERPLDALAIAILVDAWFPVPWTRLRALAPAPTIELTIHFRAPLPLADGLLLGRFRNRLVRDGFFDEDGELWDEGGALIAQSRQLGLLLGAEAP